MYTFTFVFDSADRLTEGLCNEIEVTCEMRASRDDYEVTKVRLYDLTAHSSVDFETLSQADKDKLDDLVEIQAYNHYGSAFANTYEENYFMEDGE